MAVTRKSNVSKTWTFFNGDWHEGNVAIMGARTHAAWLGSMVFDGARAFEGVTPDLDLHYARVNSSAASFLFKPVVGVETWLGLTADGLKRFDAEAELYIRPMYWAEAGAGVCHDPESASMNRRCPSRPAARLQYRHFDDQTPNARPSRRKLAASTPTMRGPSPKRWAGVLITAFCAIYWATLRSWAQPTFSWPRMG